MAGGSAYTSAMPAQTGDIRVEPTTSRSAPSLVAIAALIMGGLALAPPLIATAVWWAAGEFTPKTVLSEVSPDGRFRLSVERRVAFPAFDFLDPAVQVSVVLTEQPDGRMVDFVEVGLVERGGLGEPKASWSSDGKVTVNRIERTHNVTVTLDSRQWEQR